MGTRGLTDAWQLARLRDRSTPRRASLVVVATLIAVLGGVALGSLATARRTGGSFTSLLATTNPSTMLIEPAGGARINAPGEAMLLARRAARLPGVTRVEAAEALGAGRVVDGRPVASAFGSNVVLVASVNGLYLDMDRVIVTAGRRPDAARADEVLVTPTAAAALHVHVGSTLDVDVPGVARTLALHVVGEGVLARSIVQDQIARYPTYVLGTPALAALAGRGALIYLGLQLRDGSAGVGAAERGWTTTERFYTDYSLTSQSVSAADQSLRPLALALDTFGAIAAGATLLLALQALSRLAAARRRDREVLRALGASRLDLMVDGIPGVLTAVTAGSLGALVIGVGLSALGPLGPIRPYLAHRGVAFDPLVDGVGTAALLVALAAAAVVESVRHSPGGRRPGAVARARRPVVGAAVARSGLPISAATGARFALEGGRGTPIRWATIGSVAALAVLGATLTFGQSLTALVSRPALFGWNWDYAVQTSDGYGPVPNSAVAASHRPGVETSGVWYATLNIDGAEVPTLLASTGASVAPPVVSGHAIERRDQIELGSATMAELGVRVGSVVRVVFVPGFPKVPLRLTVVGVATLPAIGIAEGLHTSMGVGAIVAGNADAMTRQLGPGSYGGSCNGPNMVFVRSPGHPGASLAVARAMVRRANVVLSTAPASSQCSANVSTVVDVERPGPIANYRSLGTTPLLLAAGLALGALTALAAALVASVVRRRREFAVLKSLGMTQRQVVTAVAWQAGLVAVGGAVLGLPAGVLVGRWLWDVFARELGAVPSPAVSVAGIIAVGAGAIALSLLVALAPGRRAARIPAGEALRAE